MRRAMKDSGIEWVGIVPDSWKLFRLKDLISSHRGGSWGVEKQNNSNDRVCIRVADFDFEKQSIKKGERTYRNYSSDQFNRIQLVKGDILVEKSGGGDTTPVGRTVLFNEDEECTYSNFIERLSVVNGVNSEFLALIFKAMYQTSYVLKFIKQTTGIQNLDLSALFLESFALPPKEDVDLILTYLRQWLERIDHQIALQEEMIAELKAYKQSLITEAVTKGLNPDVPMKESGLERVGQVPEHWEIIRFKYYVLFNPKAILSLDDKELVTYAPMESVGNGVLEKKEIEFGKVKSGYTYFADGDIIFAKVTPCFENGNIAIADNLTNGAGYGSSELFVARPVKVNKKWLFYYLQNEVFKENAKSTMTGTGGLKRVSPQFVANHHLALPPLDEQESIAINLEHKCGDVNQLLKAKHAIIESLKEYKQSLIYECVTGKRDCTREEICT
ncbi:MAG: restriction endonuclease subunit S [Bacillota bacterium]|nr:restriction endonuclease subunit S [Bacillota bacterium]